MMFRSGKLVTYLTLGFALALIAAACGGSSSSPTVGTDQLTTTVAAAAADTTTSTTSTTTTTTTTAAPVEDHDNAEDPDRDDDEADHDEDDGDDDHADAIDADRVVEVIMDDFTFDPDSFAVTAGETVSFAITNTGVIEHEFRLSNEHRIEEHMADGHSDDDHGDDAATGHHEDADMFLHLEAGESGEITVTFPMDATVFTEVACLIPGHYEAGMAADLDYSS